MAFETPDLRTLNSRAEAHIEAELPGSNAKLRRSNLNVLARVVAMFAHGMYGFVREFLSQCLPWSKGFFLRQWAAIWNVFPIAAVHAGGSITFTGTNGAVIDVDTRLQRSDGTEYATTTAVTVAAGVAVVDVVAILPGAAGNLAAGSTLSLVLTVDDVDADATVGGGGLVGGADDESVDSLYSRYLQRVQGPAHGGNNDDYVGWALEVPGVTRAWVYGGLDGVDTVQVFFVRDDDVSIIPDAGEVATVAAHINAPGRKPVAASVGYYAPTPKVVNFTIAAVPNTADVKAAIQLELKDVIRREGTLGGTIVKSHFTEAASLAAGETDHTMTVPAGSIVCASNEIPTFGVITWL
jgi:uncharacterized phage protein gp47/JayE